VIFVITADGSLWGWGMRTFADSTFNAQSRPTQIGAGYRWRDVSNGCAGPANPNSASTTLAIRSDGTLWGWGGNSYGQLGVGDTTDRRIPVQIGIKTDWVSVSSGECYSMAIDKDGRLWG
jgi:alpha-tubulin suppressor-like RCC1 family protein